MHIEGRWWTIQGEGHLWAKDNLWLREAERHRTGSCLWRDQLCRCLGSGFPPPRDCNVPSLRSLKLCGTFLQQAAPWDWDSILSSIISPSSPYLQPFRPLILTLGSSEKASVGSSIKVPEELSKSKWIRLKKTHELKVGHSEVGALLRVHLIARRTKKRRWQDNSPAQPY